MGRGVWPFLCLEKRFAPLSCCSAFPERLGRAGEMPACSWDTRHLPVLMTFSLGDQLFALPDCWLLMTSFEVCGHC